MVKYIKCEEYLLRFIGTRYVFLSVNRKYSSKEIGWNDGVIELIHKGITKIAYNSMGGERHLSTLTIKYVL